MTTIDGSWMGLGFGVALATPFAADGGIDEPALVRLVQHVAGGGGDFVVALGSTAEAAMLDEAERDRVVDIVRRHKGPMRLVVGTGASATRQAAAWTRRAAELGADAALLVAPPYTKPTQAGIVAHFEAVAAAAPTLPLVAYNVPSRTGVSFLPSTLQRLWELPTVCAVKESSGDINQIGRIAAELPDGKALLAGDDGLMLATIAVGGTGVVSVAGNVVPDRMAALLVAARAGDQARAIELQRALAPLFDALCLEPNPIPIKAALALAGIGSPSMRLPLLPAQPATRAALQRALQPLSQRPQAATTDLHGATTHA